MSSTWARRAPEHDGPAPREELALLEGAGGRPDRAPAPDPSRTVDDVPDAVEVSRAGGVAALAGGLAAAVAIAWFGRAVASGSVLDWAVVAAVGLLAVGHLRALVDARTPLLVADAHGVRLRLGRAWRGLPWSTLARVEHEPRTTWWRDGRLVVVPHDPEAVLADLDAAGRRRTAIARRLLGDPFAVPLGPATRTTGAGDDLAAALRVLAAGAVPVVETSPEVPEDGLETGLRPSSTTDPRPSSTTDARPSSTSGAADAAVPAEVFEAPAEPHRRVRDPRPFLAHAVDAVAARLGRRPVDDAAPEPASPTPSPLRGTRPAVRTEVLRAPVLPEQSVLRRGEDDLLTGEAGAAPDDGRVRPIAVAGHPVEPLVLDDGALPAVDPVIGPELAAARTRLGLSVDQLADRTRIRPHVLESIEVDDFAPCGGDFYARGHLRTLARVLGVDATPLLAAYDERYAHAPVSPRRVFEAELASGGRGGLRATRGGPNWSVLVAATMALVLAWSVAQLVMEAPADLRQPVPTLRDGSGGPRGGALPAADAVPVVVTAVAGGATVTVRGGDGETVFSGDLAFGEARTLDVVPPVRVESDDAGAVQIRVDGADRGPVGELGAEGTKTYVVR